MEEVACFFTTSNNKSNESASKSEMARVGDTLENQEEHHQTETGEAGKDDDPQRHSPESKFLDLEQDGE